MRVSWGNVVSNEVSPANTFANEEPAGDLSGNKHIEPSLLDSQLLVTTSAE